MGEKGGPPEPKRTTVCVRVKGTHPSRSVKDPTKTVGPLMLEHPSIELTALIATTFQLEGTSMAYPPAETCLVPPAVLWRGPALAALGSHGPPIATASTALIATATIRRRRIVHS